MTANNHGVRWVVSQIRRGLPSPDLLESRGSLYALIRVLQPRSGGTTISVLPF